MRRPGPGTRSIRLGLCALALLTMGAAAADDGGPFAEETLRPLAGVARNLARAGEREIAGDLLDLSEELGLPSGEVARVRADCERIATHAIPRRASRYRSRALKSLREVIERLGAALGSLGEEDRTRAAELLLRLDGTCAPAHRALGRERVDGAWMPVAEKKLLPRRRGFADAIRKARRTPIELSDEGPVDPLVEAGTGEKGLRVSRGRIELHGALPRDRLRRILREAVRASMVANWLLRGTLVAPRSDPVRFVLFRGEREYQRALQEARRVGRISEEDYAVGVRLTNAYLRRSGIRHCLMYDPGETGAEVGILHDLVSGIGVPDIVFLDRTQASLRAGLLHLTCLSYLGAPMGSIAVIDRTGEATRRSTTEEARIRLLIRLSRAGLRGNRRYVEWLVRHEKDPPWVRTFRERIGEIEGDELAKTTSVLEFLAEHGPLLDLFLRMAGDRSDVGIATRLEKVLGEPLEDLERRWRAWLLPARETGLLERIEGRSPERRELAEDERDGLEFINWLRGEAGCESVTFDAGLAEDALLHARYLAKHPEQLSAWPDAHEEYPDREGFTPGGCWAGLHSVIAPGAGAVTEAVEGFMGTFYHRLPLLDPGLLAVGWGIHDRNVVLDAGSLVSDVRVTTIVRWPHDRMSFVPTAFQPEMPDPVPGHDQALLGYPVTLQLWTEGGGEAGAVRMSLHVGERTGPEVPAWFSTPTAPTNPDLAPRNAYCLMPKARLEPGTHYVVVAKVTDPEREIVWSFTTRR